jgi:hypothetical protein
MTGALKITGLKETITSSAFIKVEPTENVTQS